MSQRNPMNDRYQSDEKKGQTRKSAATAKPKAKAASSVRVVSKAKTPQQKKAAAKTRRQQQSQLDRQYYNPPIPEYKRWQKVYWILLIGAIVTTGISFAFNYVMPENQTLTMVVLGVGYVGIIGAFAVNFLKLNRIRKKYQAQMQEKIQKEARAEAKKERAAAAAARRNAGGALKKASEAEPEPPQKKGILSFLNLKSITQFFTGTEKK